MFLYFENTFKIFQMLNFVYISGGASVIVHGIPTFIEQVSSKTQIFDGTKGAIKLKIDGLTVIAYLGWMISSIHHMMVQGISIFGIQK